MITWQQLALFMGCFPVSRKLTRSEEEPEHTTGAPPRKKPGEAKENSTLIMTVSKKCLW